MKMTSVKIRYSVIAALSLLLISSCSMQEPASNIQQKQEIANEEALPYFDYEAINIQKSALIDLDIKGLNLYVDMYGNMVVLGEIENESLTDKSDIVFTFDFIDKQGENIFTIEQKSKARYLRSGQTFPFWQHIDEKDKYIGIDSVKVGVSYSNTYRSLKGNPVIQEEKFYYDGPYLVIEGQIINLGTAGAEELALLATFYNNRRKVVLIRECSVEQKTLAPQKSQPFKLKILMDGYLPDFTSYSFSVSFKDAISTNN